MNLVLVYQTIANENWINKFNVKRFLYNVNEMLQMTFILGRIHTYENSVEMDK